MANRPKRIAPKPGVVNLQPQEFENMIEDQGTFCRITPAVLCPNQTEIEGNNHVLDCPICFGERVVDIDEECVEDWVAITSVHLEKKFEGQGVFDMKDVQMTFRAKQRVYYFYKIEILDFSSIYNQLIKRNSGDLDRIRYTPKSDCTVPYYLIDSNGVRYILNENYRIEDQQIRWITNQPAEGTLYTFSYPVFPTFRVIELMNENRYYYDSFKRTDKIPVQLPQRALGRWDYIAKLGSGSMVPLAEPI